jgi:hypothetical protein
LCAEENKTGATKIAAPVVLNIPNFRNLEYFI